MTSASPLKAAGGRRTIKGGFWGMEKKTIRSGAPFVFAGAGVMAVALTMGIGSFVNYPVALAVGAAGYALGRKKIPGSRDRRWKPRRNPATPRWTRSSAGARPTGSDCRRQRRDCRPGAFPPDRGYRGDLPPDFAAARGEQPNMLSQLRTFLRYYLPATLKLLNARAAWKRRSAPGERGHRRACIAKAVSRCSPRFTSNDALNEFRFINLEAKWTCWRTCSNPTV